MRGLDTGADRARGWTDVLTVGAWAAVWRETTGPAGGWQKGRAEGGGETPRATGLRWSRPTAPLLAPELLGLGGGARESPPAHWDPRRPSHRRLGSSRPQAFLAKWILTPALAREAGGSGTRFRDDAFSDEEGRLELLARLMHQQVREMPLRLLPVKFQGSSGVGAVGLSPGGAGAAGQQLGSWGLVGSGCACPPWAVRGSRGVSGRTHRLLQRKGGRHDPGLVPQGGGLASCGGRPHRTEQVTGTAVSLLGNGSSRQRRPAWAPLRLRLPHAHRRAWLAWPGRGLPAPWPHP